MTSFQVGTPSCFPVRATLAGLLALGLSACSSMSPEQCKTADWGVVGLRDGQQGASTALLDAHIKDCAQVGVKLNVEQYLKARDLGLQSYCRLETAAQRGLDGASYAGVCPPNIDPEFRRRFAIGREVRDATQQVRAIRDRRAYLERRAHESGSEDERRNVREELGGLEYSLRRALDRQYDAEHQLDRLRRSPF